MAATPVNDLQTSDHTIDNSRRQELIDTGQIPGVTSADLAELVAARRRIAQPETELEVHLAPLSCSRRRCPQRPVRGHQ